MDDIAEFGFSIDSSATKEAYENLDAMAASAERAEQTSRQFEKQQQEMMRALQDLTRVQQQQLEVLRSTEKLTKEVADNSSNYYETLLNITAIAGTVAAGVGAIYYAVDTLASSLGSAYDGFVSLNEVAAKFTVDSAAAFANFSTGDYFSKTTEEAKALAFAFSDMSEQVGVTAVAVKNFSDGATGLDLGMDKTIQLVARLTEVMNENTSGARNARDAIRALGIEVEAGGSAQDLFSQIGGGLAGVSNGPSKNNIIAQIFGQYDQGTVNALKSGLVEVSEYQAKINVQNEKFYQIERDRAEELEKMYRQRDQWRKEEGADWELFSTQVALFSQQIAIGFDSLFTYQGYNPKDSVFGSIVGYFEEFIDDLPDMVKRSVDALDDILTEADKLLRDRNIDPSGRARNPNLPQVPMSGGEGRTQAQIAADLEMQGQVRSGGSGAPVAFNAGRFSREMMEGLDDLRKERDNWFTFDIEMELEYYEERLAALETASQKEGDLYESVNDKVIALRRSREQEVRSIALNETQNNMALAGTAEERLSLLEEYISTLDLSDFSDDFQRMIDQMLDRANRSVEQAAAQREIAQLQADNQIDQVRINQEQRTASELASVGEITLKESLDRRVGLVRESYENQIRLTNEMADQATTAGKPDEAARYKSQVEVLRARMNADMADIAGSLDQNLAMENFRIKLETDLDRALTVLSSAEPEIRSFYANMLRAEQDLASQYGRSTKEFEAAYEVRGDLLRDQLSASMAMDRANSVADLEKEVLYQEDLNAAYLAGGETLRNFQIEREGQRLTQAAIQAGIDLETDGLGDLIERWVQLGKERQDTIEAGQIDRMVEGLEDQKDLLIAEQRLLGESTEIREEELALIRDRLDLAEQFPGIAQEELDRLVKLRAETRELSQELAEAKRAQAEITNAFGQTAAGIGSALTNAFRQSIEDGKADFGDFRNYLKDIFFNLSADLARIMVINPVLGGVTGSLFGGDVASAAGLPYSPGGGGGGIMDLFSTGSSLFDAGSSLFNGGSSFFGASNGFSSAATSFGVSGAGQALGLGTTSFAGQAAGLGVTTGELAALGGTVGEVGLTSAGSSLASGAGALGAAMPYIAAAVAVAMLAYQTGVIGPGPTSGPVGIADFSPGLGRDNAFENGLEPFTADNGGNGEAMRPIAEAIADIIADTADDFSATINDTLRYRVANYSNPEPGNSADRVQGFEVNAFINGEAEKRIAEGLDEQTAIFEALKFAVTEAFTFDSETLQEIARNTEASDTEELLADLAFGQNFENLQNAVADLGGEVNSNTLAQGRLTTAIQDEARDFVKQNVTPIVEALQKAIELFPSYNGEDDTVSPGMASALRLAGGFFESENGRDTSNVPGFEFFRREQSDGGSYFQYEDNKYAVNKGYGRDNRDGSQFDLMDGETLIESFDTMNDLFAGVGDALSEYNQLLADQAEALAMTSEEQERHNANVARVGFAIQIATTDIDDMVDVITGDFDPAMKGPFTESLQVGKTRLEEMKTEMEATNEEIRNAYENMPELTTTLGALDDALIDVADTVETATASLLQNLQTDFLASLGLSVGSDGNIQQTTADYDGVSGAFNAYTSASEDAQTLFGDDTTGLLGQVQDQIDLDLADMLNGLLVNAENYGDTMALISTIFGDAIDDLDLLTEAEARSTDALRATDVLTKIANQELIDAEMELIQVRREERNEAQAFANQAGAAARSLRAAAEGLLVNSSLSPLSPEDRMNEAFKQFDDLYALATDDDPFDAESQSAINQLASSGTLALEAAKQFYGSSEEYNEQFEYIQTKLLDASEAMEDVEQEQLAVLKSIEELLGDNATDQPKYVKGSDGQYISTGAGGLAAGLDLGHNPESAFRIAQAFSTAGIGYTGAGEGQINAMRSQNSFVNELLNQMGFFNGATFDNGEVVPNYNGSVVSNPGKFRYGNKIGSISEFEPEAIMPLRRGADGRLGVSMQASGKGGDVSALLPVMQSILGRLEAIASNTGSTAMAGLVDRSRPEQKVWKR